MKNKVLLVIFSIALLGVVVLGLWIGSQKRQRSASGESVPSETGAMAKPGKAPAAHGLHTSTEAGRTLISPSNMKGPQAAIAKPSPPWLVPLEKAAAMNGALMTVIGEGQDRSYTTRLAAVQRLPPTLSPDEAPFNVMLQ